MDLNTYLTRDGLGLAELVRSGEVRATELLDTALARIAAVNPRLNAVVRLMEQEAREAATRIEEEGGPAGAPFLGVPFLAKDLMTHYRGHPTSAGSRLLVDLPMDHDTELARRVRTSGVLVAGKTNCPEWGLVPFTEPELWGPSRNPWDTDRTPGGSSGGSAAAVASGIVPLAGGGDGGGSIRIPASCCGLFGLKPTRGRVPTGPDYGELWRGAVVEHVLTRSVRDSAAMLDATHGADVGAPYEIPSPVRPYLNEVERDPEPLRIGFTTHPLLGSEVDPACARAVEDAASLLEELGHRVVEAAPAVDGPAFNKAFLTMVAAELGADLEDVRTFLGRTPRRAHLEPTTWALGLLSRALPAREYATALRTLERTARQVGPFFEAHDLLLTPTLACPPPEIGTLGPTRSERTLLKILGLVGSGRLIRWVGLLDQAAEDAFEFTPWTPVFNATGQPAMSVPLHWTDAGLPVGVHFVAGFGREDVLFRLAGQLERARSWFDRLPELAREP